MKMKAELFAFILLGLVVLSILPGLRLRKCEFSADDEKVVFREVFLKRTYCFSEIKSASSQVGFPTADMGLPLVWSLLLHYPMGSVLHSMMKMFPMRR